MNTVERAKENAPIRPEAVNGIHLDFANPVAVVIARPFVFGMADGSMRPKPIFQRIYDEAE